MLSRRLKRKKQWRQRLIMLTLLLCLIGVIGGFGYHKFHEGTRPDIKSFPILGLRVSQDDGFLDFQNLQKAGVNFVYLRASQGKSYSDDNFSTNYWRAVGTNMAIGVYQDYSFTSSPKAQYRQFSQTVGQQSGNLPIMINVIYYGNYQKEPPTSSRQIAHLREFVNLLRTNYHRSVVLLGNQQVATTLLRRLKLPYALASQRLPKDQHNLVFWEYSEAGKLKVAGQNQRYTTLVYLHKQARWQQFISLGQ
ncbi:GH25 family lysozyme [Loigolactobacillus iwatensis]|uniref:GH25 family lysozyme n=1 Tax=Loigolactobacillus iwatensis TaxID=1267156 RepID=UPI000F7DE390|nr:GH25 family lysozyme [Loigolactobacillus iwatensis]